MTTPHTLIFAHKGIIGVENFNKDNVVPSSFTPDLGGLKLPECAFDFFDITVPASGVFISQEALDLIRAMQSAGTDHIGSVYVGHEVPTDKASPVVLKWMGLDASSAAYSPDHHYLQASSDLDVFTAAVTVVPENVPNKDFVTYVDDLITDEESWLNAFNFQRYGVIGPDNKATDEFEAQLAEAADAHTDEDVVIS